MGVLTQTASHNNQACKQLLFGLVSYVCVYMFQCLSGLYSQVFFYANDFPIWYRRSSLILEGVGGGITPLPSLLCHPCI